MFQLFALVALLATGQPELLVHNDEFSTLEACEAEKTESRPRLEAALVEQGAVVIDMECKAKPVEGRDA